MRMRLWVIGMGLLFSFNSSVFSQMRQVHVDEVSTNNNIKNLSFYTPSSGFIACTGSTEDFVGFTTDSGHNYIERPITLANVNFNGFSVNLTFGFGIGGVKAFSQDTILVYGDYGFVPSILYSTNGGLSYILLYHSSPGPGQFTWITDMIFPQNGNIGFAVDGYRILKTTDKGHNWNTVSYDATAPYDELDATDNSNVFAFTTFNTGNPSGKLVRTTNGGSSWLLVSIPDPHIHSVDFISPLKGWLNVYQNFDSMMVYYTSNAGVNWTKMNSAVATPALYDKMRFINDSTGFAIDGSATTYKTSDSARVWEPLPRDNSKAYGHNDLVVWNGNQLWASGNREFIEISTNGGETRIPKAYFRIDTTGVNSNGNVKLLNHSRKTYSYQWFVNNVLVSTSYHATYTHIVTNSVDSVVLIVNNGSKADTLKRYQYFIVPDLPVVTSFSPVTGSTGTFVMIRGTGLSIVNSVSFGGTPAASFAVYNDTTIGAIVGTGASGSVMAADIHGGYSLPGFTYFAPPTATPPMITSFTPDQGPAGTVVTITGQNFGTSASANVVYFGAGRATISSATPTQIVCTVPPTTTLSALTVLNLTNGLRGSSDRGYRMTFADSSNFTSNSFINDFNIEYDISTYPKYIDGQDLNNDGKPDLVVIKASAGDSLIVYKNTSPGNVVSFGPGQALDAVGSLSGARFTIGDLDGDGMPDIVSGTNYLNVFVFKNISNSSTIQFAPKYLVPTSPGNQNIALADLDNDGRPDMSISCYNNSIISLLRNTSAPGNISFAAKVDLVTPSPVLLCSSGDLDGDGKRDLVSLNFINTSSSSISIYPNQSTTGTLSFGTRVDITLAGSALNGKAVDIVDMDLDGKPDLVVVNDNNYFLFRNTSSLGSISFAAPTVVNIPGFIYGGFVAHMSGDRKPDLMFGRNSFRYFTLQRNISTPGNIVLDPPVDIEANFPHNIFSYFSNCIDFTLDGKPDIVASGTNDRKISIYRNNMGSPVLFGTNICAGSSRTRFSDVSGSTYQWQENAGSGFANISDNSNFTGTQTLSLTINNIPLAWHGRLYRCIVNGSYYSSQFILNVNTNLPPSVSISTPTTTVCAGSLVSFTANGVNTSQLTSYQWQVNGVNVGPNSSVFTTSSLTNGSQVKVILFNPCSTPNTATSNTITMTVLGGTPAVSVNSSATSICPGTTVTFTANPTNGGPSPAYQWKLNGANAGTNSPTFVTNSLNNNDQVQVIMTPTPSSCGNFSPVTSNTITITVQAVVTPSASIVANPNPFCQGAFTTITATPVNGGSNPSYQWQINGINIGANTNPLVTGFLSNGDQVRVIMTSNASCPVPPTATSNVVIIGVTSNIIPSIAVSGNTTVNTGQSSLISTSIVNGGSAPTYQWQDFSLTQGWQNINGATATTINYTPAATGVKLRCVLSSNAPCVVPTTAFSNELQFTVNVVTAINPVPIGDYGIRYYPNPVDEKLYIDSLRLSDKWQTLTITNILGAKILEMSIANKKALIIPVTGLVPGNYFAILRRKNGAAFLKFLKK